MILEKARSQIFYKTLDAAFTASLRSPTGVATQFGSLVSPRTSNYDRVAMFVGLLDRAFPGAQRRLSTAIHRPASLPFAVDSVRLLGYGSGATVFFLERDGWQRVLKIYRRTIGRSRRALSQLASDYRGKLATARRWYGDLVVPAHYLILHSPLLGAPAVAALQKFLPDIGQDIFACHSAGNLQGLLSIDEPFRNEFIRFARKTLEIADQEQRCPDLLGEGNVLVMRHGDRHELRMIDYGGFDLEDLRQRSAPALEKLELRLTTLSSVLAGLDAA